jgi:hypothetical protein
MRRTPEAVTLSATAAAIALRGDQPGKDLAAWIEALAFPGTPLSRTEEPLRVFLQIHRGAGERVADFVHDCVLSLGQPRRHG